MEAWWFFICFLLFKVLAKPLLHKYNKSHLCRIYSNLAVKELEENELNNIE